MRLTIVVLAGIAANAAVGGPVLAQEKAHITLAATLGGVSPLLQRYSEAAVQRAFRSVLNREPTGSELRRYRALMEEYGWTEADIQKDLRDRPDYQRYSTNRRGMRPEAIVRRAYEDILGREPDAEGLRSYRSRIVDEGWSEQDVREALRRSPEYASGAARTSSADRIIRRAYQDILRREPDPSGLETYRRNIIERGWDEQDVRQALRRSTENRQVRAETRQVRRGLTDAEATEMVRRAYLSVLNREPDPSGLSEYKAKILRDRWTEQQLLDALRSSDEYRSKH
jgi:TorA maturation chaperone TorD